MSNKTKKPKSGRYELAPDWLQPPASNSGSSYVPDEEFVLCHNLSGEPTAVYGQDRWDFNPIRLGAHKIPVIRFDGVFLTNGEHQAAILVEARFILFCLIYYSGNGRLGRISPGTIIHYWYLIVAAMRFCQSQDDKPLVGFLSLKQLLTTSVYIGAFVQGLDPRMTERLSRLLMNLVLVGEERLGYRVLSKQSINVTRAECNQVPVIPTRIYLGIINGSADFLDRIYQRIEHLEPFIASFHDQYFGLHLERQKSLGLGGRKHYRLDISEALKLHDLQGVFIGDLACPHKKQVLSVIGRIQYVMKIIIQLYTGMRDHETLRMKYDCVKREVYVSESVDDAGAVCDQAKMVSVLSTTTKYKGFRKKESWYAPTEAMRAIEVSQAICRGLSKIYGIEDYQQCMLFLNPAILSYKNTEVGVARFSAYGCRISFLNDLVIDDDDLLELSHTDENRDFYNDKRFAVGQPWPLTSHQFRRSLAFFGGNSKFVSLPTLKSQYKHMTLGMARYYRNGFDQLKTIFGYYDFDKKDFVLPDNHFALEYQTGIPMSVANRLVSELLSVHAPLFGGAGVALEQTRVKIIAGDLHVEDVRAQTLARVQAGELSFTPTLLGGCAKSGRCDLFLLGDYTSCLSCEDSIIELDKVDSAVDNALVEVEQYKCDSAEYQIVTAEIQRLTDFSLKHRRSSKND